MPSGLTGTFLALGALRLRRDGRRSPCSNLSSVGIGGGPRLPKKHRLLAAEVLPALDGNLDVLRVDLDGEAAATQGLGCPAGRAGARGGLVHGFTGPQVVADRDLGGEARLLRRVVGLLLGAPGT